MTTLACRKLAPHPESPRHQHAGPWLVWLHGLLGSRQDWLPVAQLCGDYPSLLIDLPGHGQSVSLSADGFADISRQLSQTLQANGIREYWLAGYSLGGRIAMYHACYGRHHGLQGLLVEGETSGWKTLNYVRRGCNKTANGRSAFARSLCHRYWMTGISRRYLPI